MFISDSDRPALANTIGKNVFTPALAVVRISFPLRSWIELTPASGPVSYTHLTLPTKA